MVSLRGQCLVLFYYYHLYINGKELKRSFCIKYLGILIDSHLNWKDNIDYISRKIKRTIGIIYELQYYVNIKTLVNVYNALIHPFLIYGILAWGNTYPTTLKPLIILQKKARRVMTFSKFDAHSSPLFNELKIIKFLDLVSLHITIFMHKFQNNNLPVVFNNYFTPVNQTQDQPCTQALLPTPGAPAKTLVGAGHATL